MDFDAIVESLRGGPLFFFLWFVVMGYVLWNRWKRRRRERGLAVSAGRYDPKQVIAIFRKRRIRAFRGLGISIGLALMSGFIAYLVGDKSVPIFAAAVIAAVVFWAFGCIWLHEVYRCPVCTRVPMTAWTRTGLLEWEQGLEISPHCCLNCGAKLM